jgi:demethylmenaquinone methyltransferase/2-methoxy-6-polyprenyl-1,4-benzoquinol methylase
MRGMETPSPAAQPTRLVPQAPLSDYYADEPSRQAFVRRLFDATASDYDRIEHLLAFGSGAWYRRQALGRAGLRAGDRVVDVGIGTGLVAREALALIGPEGRLTGVDPSVGMMDQVHLSGVELKPGRAEAIPCDDASSDFVSMGYALRHLGDFHAAAREFRRVLTPGGRLLILEITPPAGRLARLALKAYMRGLVPLLARLVARQRATAQLWRYYWDTIEACIPPERVVQALQAAGFTDVRRHVELGVFSEYTARAPGTDGAGAAR